eukprot:COSAG05_NODE_5946_length_1053_cov_1.237945_2_plen_27_part_01
MAWRTGLDGERGGVVVALHIRLVGGLH